MTEQTREALDSYIEATGKRPGSFLFSSRRGGDRAMTTRQYARLVAAWTASVGLDRKFFGTHSLRWTKLGHKKIESTVRHLGVEVDDALAIAEQVDV